MNMRNEKQNDTAWISKLDEPDCLPAEEMIDKNAAWKKLHERLRRKPLKDKMIWYRAAACLFIAFSFSIFIAHKNPHPLVKNILTPQKKATLAVDSSSLIAEKGNGETAAYLSLAKKEKYHVTGKHLNNSPHDENNSTSQVLPDAVVENATAIKQKSTIDRVAAIDTTALITAAITPTKKKMRIVHINELENVPEGMILTTPNQQQNNFGVSIGNNNQTNKQISVARDYAGIFKIKISSKN